MLDKAMADKRQKKVELSMVLEKKWTYIILTQSERHEKSFTHR